VEPFNVAVALRRINAVRRGDAEPPERSEKREEVECVPLSVVIVKFSSRLPSGSRSSTQLRAPPRSSSYPAARSHSASALRIKSQFTQKAVIIEY
jgi:hypothetical protein